MLQRGAQQHLVGYSLSATMLEMLKSLPLLARLVVAAVFVATTGHRTIAVRPLAEMSYLIMEILV